MRQKVTKVLIVLVLVPFIILPLYSDFIIGVFSWHISVPAYWSDLIELMIYVLLIFGVGTFFPELRLALCLIVGGAYLTSMGTIIQVFVAYLFIEGICFIGRVTLKYLFESNYSNAIEFLVGSVVLGGIFIFCSLLKFGTIENLRIVFIISLTAFVVIGRKCISIGDFLLFRVNAYTKELSRIQWLLLIPLIASLLISFARVNTHLESDSSWYALYTDKNLFGENSFYDFLGYTGFIYYYPKFKELLMAPLSGLKLAGYLIAPNIWIMLLMVVETYGYIKSKVDEQKKSIVIIIVSMIYTTMAIIGTAGTAKSDTLGYFYILICWITFSNFIEKYDYRYLWLSIISGIIPFAVKYTHYIWATTILAVFFVYFIVLFVKKRLPSVKYVKSGVSLMLITLGVLCGILGRTIYLTGFPFGRVGVGFLKKIGFIGKSLFEFDETSNLPSVFYPIRIWNSLFMVGQAEKITAQWIGNFVLFFIIILLLTLPFKKIWTNVKLEWWKWLLIILLNILFIYLLVTMYAPDGNYFEMTIIFTMTECFIMFCKEEILFKEYRRVFAFCGIVFCVLNICLNFTVDPSWGCGTRFSYEKISTVKTQEDNKEYLTNMLKTYGINEINEYLHENEKNSFVILDSGNAFLMCLDVRVEMATDLSSSYISATDITSMESFVDYVNKAGVKGFIISNDDSGDALFEMYAKQYLNAHGWIKNIEDQKYTYYKIG